MKPMIILATIVLLALAAWKLLRVYEQRQVFHPRPGLEETPADRNLAYRDLSVSSGAETLQAWLVPADRPRGVMLYCHGNFGNLSDCLDTVEVYRRLGLDVAVFDYRVYGNSSGTPDEAGTYEDAEAAWKFLTEDLGYDPARTVVFGRSLGGAVALRLAADRRPAALIVEASFPSLRQVAERLHPALPVGLMLRYRYPGAEYAARTECPKLFIHSRDDNLIPLSLGRELYAAAAEPKEFLEIGGPHASGFLETGPPYIAGVGRFLDRVLGPRP